MWPRAGRCCCLKAASCRVLLTLDLLGELEERWRSQRVPLLDQLSPGLSDGEMDRLTSGIGLRLPDEARL